jgi:hypothetical protein
MDSSNAADGRCSQQGFVRVSKVMLDIKVGLIRRKNRLISRETQAFTNKIGSP